VLAAERARASPRRTNKLNVSDGALAPNFVASTRTESF
jgi:hypothetical protein